jgi:hypothetical protein
MRSVKQYISQYFLRMLLEKGLFLFIQVQLYLPTGRWVLHLPGQIRIRETFMSWNIGCLGRYVALVINKLEDYLMAEIQLVRVWSITRQHPNTEVASL